MATFQERLAPMLRAAQDTADLSNRLTNLEAKLKALLDTAAQVESRAKTFLDSASRIDAVDNGLKDGVRRIGELRAAMNDLDRASASSVSNYDGRVRNLESKV